MLRNTENFLWEFKVGKFSRVFFFVILYIFINFVSSDESKDNDERYLTVERVNKKKKLFLFFFYINNIEFFLYFPKKEEDVESELLKSCNVLDIPCCRHLYVLYQEKENEREREKVQKKVRIIVFPTIDDYRNKEKGKERERKQSFFFVSKFPFLFVKLTLQATYTYT